MKRYMLFFFFFCHVLNAGIEDKLEFVLERLPEWNADSAKVKEVTGGATNYNYVVKYKNDEGLKHRYFIRIESENREFASGDISSEIKCQQIAAEHGIAPKIILSFPEEGIIVTEYVRTKKNFVDVTASQKLQSCLEVIKSIHELPVLFPNSANPFDLLEEFAGKAKKLNCLMPYQWNDSVISAVSRMKKVLYHKCQSVPCHLDLSPQNLLDDGKKIWVIDWEFSANSDPIFDLGTLASVAFFDDNDLQSVIDFYCDEVTKEAYAKLYMMTILADLRWYFWCLVQMETSSLDCPYSAWADGFLEQAIKRIQNPQFKAMLDLFKD